MRTDRVFLLAILFLIPIIAGCVDAEAPPEDPGPDDPLDDGEDPVPTFGPHSGLPTERPDDYTPSLDAPPQWVLGEWWDVEIAEQFTGATHTVKRVVGGLEGMDYLVGMPRAGFNDEVMILHFPGFGLVDSDTLGYEAHDWMFEPVQFPLEEGKNWQTYWQSEDVILDATVTAVDEESGRATIEMEGNQAVTLVYDAELGAIVEFDAPGYATYNVVDHGFDYDGYIRVPHSHDLLFFHARLANTGAGFSEPTAGPIETITVPDEYDRTSFSLLFFEMVNFLASEAPDTVGHGVHHISVEAPDGTVFEATKDPTMGGHLIESFSHDVVGGDWELTIATSGSAQVLLEGIGYVVFDVDLPEGCVVPTERVHDHGGICGGHVHDIE